MRFVFLVCLLFSNALVGQVTDTVREPSAETNARAQAYDFTTFLYNNEKFGATGVFDTTYGRLQMRFDRVEKDATNPLVYNVRGASRHLKQVTPFAGELRITNIERTQGTLDDMLRRMPGQGPEDNRMVDGAESGDFIIVTGVFNLREDSTKKFSGVFDGEFQFALRLRPDGTLSNDWNRVQSRYFRNFIYQGMWTAYNGRFAAPVAWADGRIPVRDGVDVGAAEFQVAPRYEKDGWKRNADGNFVDNPEYWWRR